MKPVYAVALGFLGVAATAGAVFGVVHLAVHERTAPARCGAGLVAQVARCCAPGQVASSGHCSGTPKSCPEGMRVSDSTPGCVAEPRRVTYRGGRVSLGAEDWEAEGVIAPRNAEVAAFSLDATEVTLERWDHCARAGACRKLEEQEPGVPVRAVEPKEAEAFCRFEGGRLPTSDEWLFAAMGPDGRRFPWGATGLVCRRAAFGLVDGPCARGTAGPELAGSRLDGATPEGALDLAGNVAEWTMENAGRYVARGGSYRSRTALELKSWSFEVVPAKAPNVGFRCAYDVQKPRPPAPIATAPAQEY
jgi:formylglycine-generating enzyme required for sulfatase activity